MKVSCLFIFCCFMGIFIFISPSQVMSEVEEAQAPVCTYVDVINRWKRQNSAL